MALDNSIADNAIDRFADLTVPVEVRIGKSNQSVKAIYHLDVGSVFGLDKPAGETVDVLVGNVRLGSAEVVVIDDRLAVRMTEILRSKGI